DFDILGNTYETYLGHTLYFKDDGTLGLRPSQATRKESGIYYTPPYVVDYIIRNTLGELLKGKTPEEVEKIRVLDPACGSGSFLIKAFDYFKDYYDAENERIREEREKRLREYLRSGGNQLKLDEMNGLEYAAYRDVEKKILENNIFGVDLDRQAAEIASVNLMLKALKPKEKLPLILDENIRVGNSLISGSEEELREYFGESWEDKKPFNWKEAFGEEGFDVVVGNPPYVNVANLSDDERDFLMGTYQSAVKRLDIYIAFIERGVSLLKNGGKISFIIPYPFLNQNYSEKMRKMILDNCLIEEIVDLSAFKIFSDATVRNIIIILKKELDEAIRTENRIKITTQEKNPSQESKISGNHFYIPQQVFYHTPEYMFRLELNEKTIPIIKKVSSNGINFGKILVASWGARGVPVSQFHLDQRMNDLCRKMIKGGNVGRYSLNYSGKWLLYDISKLYRPSFPELFESEKLVISKVTGKTGLIATYDDEKHYTDDSLCCCILKHNLKDADAKILRKHKLYVGEEEIELSRGYDLKYVLGLINSKLLNFYFKTLLGYALNVYPESIEQLPIYPATPSQQKPIIELVDRMLTLNKDLHRINIDFDRFVSLYPRVKDTTLKDYIKDLPVSDKEVLKDHYGNPINQIKGKIKAFEIIEEGEWLVFKVGYIFKTTKGKEVLIENVRAFRCRIEDVNLRKFLYYSIKEYVKPGKIGKGNIYERILKIKVPRFAEREEENRKVIDEIMEVYLDEVERRVELEREIEARDEEIDRMVYELYGLSEEEIRVVEGSK
ncbi:MAG: Eco57I restriction-modification methylase domain-containing protein, partial [Candidatus Syntropharchaeales archaeon]